MTESMNNKELALQQFVKLKSLYEYPRLYLISYFSELRNEVNISLNKIENTTNVEAIKQLDLNWTQIIDKINDFKTECLENMNNNNLIDVQQIVNSLEKEIFNSNSDLNKLKETINEYIYKLEANLFQKRTIFFHKNNNKLIIIQNDYIGKNQIVMFKQLEFSQLKSELIKYEFEIFEGNK
jgi:hypothetical protein